MAPAAAGRQRDGHDLPLAHRRPRGAICRRADVLIAAVGVPHLVQGDWVKPGATVIDVGMNRLESGLTGDVDFAAARRGAGAITPVPGGVGPMTIACLLRNTLQAAELVAAVARRPWTCPRLRAGELLARRRPPSRSSSLLFLGWNRDLRADATRRSAGPRSRGCRRASGWARSAGSSWSSLARRSLLALALVVTVATARPSGRVSRSAPRSSRRPSALAASALVARRSASLTARATSLGGRLPRAARARSSRSPSAAGSRWPTSARTRAHSAAARPPAPPRAARRGLIASRAGS